MKYILNIMTNFHGFYLAILTIYANINVVEYQKVKIANYEINNFPYHIVIKTIYADYQNELYKSYVKSKKPTLNAKGIPLRIEFKEI